MTDVAMPTGRTRLFAILADPVDHIRAPVFSNPAFAARGHGAFLVPPPGSGCAPSTRGNRRVGLNTDDAPTGQ